MRTEKLGNLFTIQKGRKHNIVEFPSSESIRVIQIDDLRNDELIKYTNDKNGVMVSTDDILIVWDGANAGTVGFGKAGYIGSTICALRRQDTNKYHTPYLGLFLQTKLSFFKKSAVGSTIPHLDRKVLEGIAIPIPPLNDQIRISTVLQKAQILIRQREESLELLNQLLKNTFLKMFSGYEQKSVVKLSNIATITSGLTKGKKYEGKETKFVPYMRVANVQDGFFDLKEIKEIEATKEDIKRYSLKKDDLLLTEGGDADKLGRGALWNNQIRGCIFQNHIFRVRVIDLKKINPIFLAHQTGSEYGKRYFLKSAKQTTGIASINSTQLKNFPAYIAPIKKQLHFAQIAGKIQALKDRFYKSQIDLVELHASISQKAFEGELDLSLIQIEKIPEPTNVDSEKHTELAVDSKVLKSITTLINLVRRHENANNRERFIKALMRLKNLIAPFNDLSDPFKKIEEIKVQIKMFESNSLYLEINKSKKSDNKIIWENVSFEQVARWIKERFWDEETNSGYHFNSEMLLRFLTEEHVIIPHYYSSEELKRMSHLNESDDLKSMIFAALKNENPYLKLTQVFYNGEDEELQLKIAEDDLELIKNRTARERSGVYFFIAE